MSPKRRRAFTWRRRAHDWLKRRSLRTRVVALFTLGAAIAALVLVVLTYSLTRGSLLDQREESSRTQFFANARQVQASLRSENPDFSVLLESLPSLADSRPIVWTGENTWRSPSLTPDALPEALVEAVIRTATVGSPASTATAFAMRYSQNDQRQFALGLRLQPNAVSPLGDIAYFEVVPLAEIESTLLSLRAILLAGGAITVLLGAGIGVFASQRLLQPLAVISEAATSIAEGHFETRVTPSEDPDLAKITQSFNDMASSMERRIARDARFSSDVSHELRSPLQTLRSSIDVMMRRRHELSESSVAALDLLASDVDRLEQLVKDLLEISQTDEGEGTSHMVPVNMAKLVRHSVKDFDSSRISDLSLKVEPAADRALVIGDKRRLIQILDNLLRNAEKYGEGVVEVEMRLSSGSDGSLNTSDAANGSTDPYMLISVEDNGPGIAPSEREIVFERFTRGAFARKRAVSGGAGLGLALVYEHARRHGGATFVESKADGSRGARFVVQLPLANQTAAEAQYTNGSDT